MVRNNALAEKLNHFKSGAELPIPENISEDAGELEQHQEAVEEVVKNSLAVQTYNYILEITFFLSKCIAFGYASKIIFKTDWKFIPIFVVGFSIEVLTTKVLSVFQKN